ncbi:B mating type pheromone receptor [Trametes coccinea BRFM310]|uniref:B mating type pheromone receptor n=1 Tax=Trametes coccinea (strain BRFM310) TaxID=1353009 RepID=A0A1Y2IRK7_TRAC3|nr:B mating type pheromone receptor [Trametes coccinea BRFM310]
MAYPILPISAFIGAVLVLVPVPSHWRARNYATVSLVAWLFILDVIYGINSIVWRDNVEIKLLVWCDITTKLTIGASVALPAAAMCICKHLELVASGRVVRVSHADKRRRMYFDLAMCYSLPAIIMALHYIVQGHRFDIVEAFGCQPATYYSIPGVFIVWFPPLLLAVISMVYAGLALYHFLRHRVTFATVLQNSNSSITPNRYLRLMALAVTEIIWQITLTVLPMYDNISAGLRPWTTWADVHSDWLRVDRYLLVEFVPAYRQQLFLVFFAIPASSLLFFIFFGFGEQAVRDYRHTFDWVRAKVFRQKNNMQTKGMMMWYVSLRSAAPYVSLILLVVFQLIRKRFLTFALRHPALRLRRRKQPPGLQPSVSSRRIPNVLQRRGQEGVGRPPLQRFVSARCRSGHARSGRPQSHRDRSIHLLPLRSRARYHGTPRRSSYRSPYRP